MASVFDVQLWGLPIVDMEHCYEKLWTHSPCTIYKLQKTKPLIDSRFKRFIITRTTITDAVIASENIGPQAPSNNAH